VPLAAGENHYTRFEFSRVIEDPARPLEDRWRKHPVIEGPGYI